MAYLVTGGTGFIGSYVVRDLLNAGKQVVCVQRSGITALSRSVVAKDDLDKVKIVQGDLSNTLQLFHLIEENDIDLVVHLGYLAVDVSDLQPSYALQVNCIGTNNLLEASRLFKLKRIVWTSSNRAFGRVNEFYDKPIKDDDGIYMPTSMYGATKTLNEYMVKLYFNKFGVDSIGLRLALTFGIGREWGSVELISRLLKNAALNVPVKVPIMDANRTRCFSYVENVSDLIVKACDAPTTKTRVFNVPEYQCSFRQLIELIHKVNPQARVTIDEGVETAESIWRGAPESIVDNKGALTELGWKPKYSLEEMIRKMFNYFHKQEGLPQF